MKLSDLTAYAEEELHIREQHKWADFPGFSVLADPVSGKWFALLMRQWDYETGHEVEHCDIKCGQELLSAPHAAYLTPPFRMKGRHWIGVRFDEDTEAETVYRLLDKAAAADRQRGYTIVLDDHPARLSSDYTDTPLLFTGAALEAVEPDTPDRILEMRRLYEYGDGSLRQKSKNFYRQGKYMEDYTDNAPWLGVCSRYFPTYHDLNLKQLRGYFTWRTWARKGDYRPTAESFPYIYLYELLNGIGTASPLETLDRLREFEKGYLDIGLGNEGMRKNLHRWMLEYAVLHDLPAETARSCADPALMEQDHALAVLKHPGEHTDGTVFDALCVLAGEKLKASPLVTGDGERGKYLFAALWNTAMEETQGQLFTACFGERAGYPWRPLSNAVYWEEAEHAPGQYMLNASRGYSCRGGIWEETRYDPLRFDRERFCGLLHEGDRQFRKYLKAGHYLREKREEAWAAVYAEQVIHAEEAARLEASRPKINIDLTGLEQIRRDAGVTRDSLLTEEELAESTAEPETAEKEPAFDGLDAAHLQILVTLLHGGSAAGQLKERHLMPAVAADTINEAFYDEIGDSVVECDGTDIILVDDYREDLERILGGSKA